MTPPQPALLLPGTRVRHRSGAVGTVIEADHCAFRVLWDLVGEEDLGSDVFSRKDMGDLFFRRKRIYKPKETANV